MEQNKTKELKSKEADSPEIMDPETRNRNKLLELMKKGVLPQARPMTRSERKKLDESGFNIGKQHNVSDSSVGELAENMVDWILDNIYPNVDFDGIANNVCSAFALYTYKLTYQDDIAAKN